MCTIGRTPAGTAGKAHHRADTEGNPIRGGQERTDCGSKRGRNSFLSTALAPVALKSLVVETYDGLQCGSINVITRENYEFLRDSFFKYALLLQKEAAHTPGNSIGEGIARLYDEMDALVGDELNVNIEQERGRCLYDRPGRDSSRIMSVVSLYSSRCRETRWLMNPSRVTFPFLEAPARMDSFRCRAAGICSDRRCTPAMPCRYSSP